MWVSFSIILYSSFETGVLIKPINSAGQAAQWPLLSLSPQWGYRCSHHTQPLQSCWRCQFMSSCFVADTSPSEHCPPILCQIIQFWLTSVYFLNFGFRYCRIKLIFRLNILRYYNVRSLLLRKKPNPYPFLNTAAMNFGDLLRKMFDC